MNGLLAFSYSPPQSSSSQRSSSLSRLAALPFGLRFHTGPADSAMGELMLLMVSWCYQDPLSLHSLFFQKCICRLLTIPIISTFLHSLFFLKLNELLSNSLILFLFQSLLILSKFLLASMFAILFLFQYFLMLSKFLLASMFAALLSFVLTIVVYFLPIKV